MKRHVLHTLIQQHCLTCRQSVRTRLKWDAIFLPAFENSVNFRWRQGSRKQTHVIGQVGDVPSVLAKWLVGMPQYLSTKNVISCYYRCLFTRTEARRMVAFKAEKRYGYWNMGRRCLSDFLETFRSRWRSFKCTHLLWSVPVSLHTTLVSYHIRRLSGWPSACQLEHTNMHGHVQSTRGGCLFTSIWSEVKRIKKWLDMWD